VPGYVHVSAVEIERIAAYLGRDIYDVTRRFTRLTSTRKGLSLDEWPDGSCIFLERDGGCRVHPVKPRQCAEFPFAWRFEGAETLCPVVRELQPA
jgi:Fe-S-cluster containining protein